MKERSAYKFRIYPDAEQKSLFVRTIGCCALVYNLCREQRKLEYHRSEPRRISAMDQIKELGALKEEAPFLKEVPHHALVQAVMDLHKAYVNFFENRAAYPRPRSKVRHKSFRYPDPKQFRIENGRIFLPKAGWVKMVDHREVVGTPKSVTVSLHAGMWHVSILVEREIDPPQVKIGEIVGIDLNKDKSIALSDGEVYSLPLVSKEERRREAAIQKAIARRSKGSKNWLKAVRKFERLRARQARRRRDAKHKATAKIARRYAVVAVEDLKVRNMTASARGTVENPGRNVAQKAGLNRTVLDLSPGETVRQIEYKMRREGGRMVAVNPACTSQQCSCCEYVNAGNRPTRDDFRCLSCGFAACADLNAARNVLARGLVALGLTGGRPGMVCGSSRTGGRKQKTDGREVRSPVLQRGE